MDQSKINWNPIQRNTNLVDEQGEKENTATYNKPPYFTHVHRPPSSTTPTFSIFSLFCGSLKEYYYWRLFSLSFIFLSCGRIFIYKLGIYVCIEESQQRTFLKELHSLTNDRPWFF